MRSSSFTTEASRRWLLIGVAAVASLAGIVIYALGALQPLQNAASDESFSLRGARPPLAASSSSPLTTTPWVASTPSFLFCAPITRGCLISCTGPIPG